MRVLVVEDDDQLLRVLASALNDYDVVRASTIGGAVAALSDGEFSVVLADLALDGSVGAGTLAALRAADPYVPIVVYTGSVDESGFAALLDAGADDVIGKPARLSTIRRRLLVASLAGERRQAAVLRLCAALDSLEAAAAYAAGGAGHDSR